MRWMEKYQKGQMTMEAAVASGIMFVVLIITIGIGATILSGIKTGQTVNGSAWNITGLGEVGFINFSGQFGNVGTVLAAALILTILITGLGFLAFKNQGAAT